MIERWERRRVWVEGLKVYKYLFSFVLGVVDVKMCKGVRFVEFIVSNWGY